MPTDVYSSSARGISSTVVMSVAGAYVTGDYIGTSAVPQAFVLPPSFVGRSPVIGSLTVNDNTTTAAVAMELWLFNTTFTAPTDNAAWAITDADNAQCAVIIPLATDYWYASSNNKTFYRGGLGAAGLQPTGPAIYYALVARGNTPNWSSGDLKLTIGLL